LLVDTRVVERLQTDVDQLEFWRRAAGMMLAIFSALPLAP
jgi:hypothetical protein